MQVHISKSTSKAVKLYREISSLELQLEEKQSKLDKLISKLSNPSYCKYALITTAIDKGYKVE